MQKQTRAILDELISKNLITKDEDLTAGEKTNIIFDYLVQNYAHLLENDIDTVLPDSSFQEGETFHKLITKYGKLFLKNPQIIEDRCKLLRNDTETFPDRNRASLGKVKLPDEPVIFIANHHFKDDVLATILAAERRAFILFGSLPKLYGTIDGLLAIKNGVAVVNRKIEGSRHASIDKCQHILKKGMDLIIYPEGVWNKKPNGEMLDFYSGFYRTAKKEDGSFYPIVPIIHYINNTHKKGKDNPIYTVIDDPIYLEGKNAKEEIIQIRENMLTWYYKCMENYGTTTRSQLLQGFNNATEAWEDELEQRVKTAGKYDTEIELSADKKNPNDSLLVWEAIENATPGIPYVKELKRNDFQHRF